MFISEEEFNRILAIMDGKIVKSPLQEELEQWVKNEFDKKMYGYICDYARTDSLRLIIVFWSLDDHKDFSDQYNYIEQIQIKFAEKFSKLAKKYQIHLEYQGSQRVLVCYESIEDQIQQKTLHMAKDELYAIAQDEVWKVLLEFDHVIIFYYTDEQVNRFEEDGTSQALRQKCSEIVKQYDNYGVYPKGIYCEFCSKQTIDEKYCGNMFYFYKR